MTGYGNGVRLERDVINDLKANGYQTMRAASSKGVCDCIGIKAGQIVLVSCKRTSMPGPAERAQLLAVAALIPGVLIPLVALKPLRRPLAYRRLTGPGPSDWLKWWPDLIGDVPAVAGVRAGGEPG
jgi:holliday junction resolvase Hjr